MFKPGKPSPRIWAIIRRLALVLFISLVCVEFILHLVLPRFPSYQEVIAKSLQKPERLFESKQVLTINVSGLYRGAGEVSLRVSSNRFIEPEPVKGTYRVLFLGGSTTEALYVPESKRWVAQINSDEIAAFNAGQSGANTLDEYFTFRYLTEKGFKFDLVVLMTAINDFGTQLRFAKVGRNLELISYEDSLKKWYLAEYESKQTLWDWVKENILTVYLFSTYFDSPTSVVQVYQARMPTGKPVVDQCPTLDQVAEIYAMNAERNLKILAEAVHETGAKFLVMSEATSYGAPSRSFVVDLRFGPECGESILSNAGTYELWKKLNALYLKAAQSSGSLTFDLAAAISPYTNGPNGGSYIYDEVHYTPEGCTLVATTLRPILLSILRGAQ